MRHLDTNIAVAYLNDVAPVPNKLTFFYPRIAISTVVVAELMYGARNSERPESNLARLNEFMEIVEVVSFDLKAARICGDLRHALKKIGKPSTSMDLLIAASAFASGATLVTHNIKHFENIEGLQLEDWLA